jgi:hypothetical protein
MIHGPCGALNPHASCMVDGICSKGFPKPLTPVTLIKDDGYAQHRREDGPIFVERKVGNQTFKLNDEWVVPYNPFLSCMFDCHINLEYISTISAVAYIHKYIHKGKIKKSTIRVFLL